MTLFASDAWRAAADIWDGTFHQPTPGLLAAQLTSGRELQAPHLDVIDQAYRDLETGARNRIMVFAPPRHGKSQRTVRWGALWWLQRHKQARVAIASYAAELAQGHSRWIRDTIDSHPALGLRLSPASRAMNRWDLDRDTFTGHAPGGLIALGVGTGFTGKGADLLVVDDPVKDAEEADSHTSRESVWAWWQSVSETRLEPDAKILLIQTRWHEDDLAGRLLAEFADDWQVLNMPALAEPGDLLGRGEGEALWPARYDEVALANIRRRVGARWWTALYQQRPAPPEGAIWRRQWIARTLEGDMPQLVKIVVGVDPAATSAVTSDETGIVIAGIDAAGRGYVLDDRTLRGSPGEWGEAVWDAFLDWDATEVVLEKPPLFDTGKYVLQTTWEAVARRRQVYRNVRTLPIRPVDASRGKRLRAEPIATLYEQGMVSHMRHLPALEEQMLNWTGDGDSPDHVDALVHALTGLFLDHGKQGRLVVGQRWAGGRQ